MVSFRGVHLGKGRASVVGREVEEKEGSKTFPLNFRKGLEGFAKKRNGKDKKQPRYLTRKGRTLLGLEISLTKRGKREASIYRGEAETKRKVGR